LDSISLALRDQQAGIARATHQKQVGSFDKWRRFLETVGIDDEWLDRFSKPQRTHILCAFAAACRRNKCGKTGKQLLTSNTVKATITHVRSTFRSNLRSDPALDVDDKPLIFLVRQLKGYTDTDAPPKQQTALPLSVFHALHDNIFTPLDEAMGRLACGAFFFGMRSCEYLTVQGTRKTKRLKLRNIRFFKNNVQIPDQRSPLVLMANSVSITFEF
jgi:hypothetical protein